VLESSKKIFEKSAQLELALGVAYYGQRRFEDAVDSFLRVTTLAPDIEQPYVFLARIIDHAGIRIPEVSQKFAEYARANARNYLGPFLHAKGLIAQLGSASQSSVTSHQSSVISHRSSVIGQRSSVIGQRSSVIGQQSSVSRAESLLRKSIALNENYWESHFELGLLLERRRDFVRAAEQLQRSIQLNPTNPTTHYRLARIYDRLGKPDQAKTERALHEQLTAEERTAVEKHAAGVKRLDLIVR
jgi:Flp pilus assembly protein TadD